MKRIIASAYIMLILSMQMVNMIAMSPIMFTMQRGMLMTALNMGNLIITQ